MAKETQLGTQIKVYSLLVAELREKKICGLENQYLLMPGWVFRVNDPLNSHKQLMTQILLPVIQTKKLNFTEVRQLLWSHCYYGTVLDLNLGLSDFLCPFKI